jgi:hypothetical protein
MLVGHRRVWRRFIGRGENRGTGQSAIKRLRPSCPDEIANEPRAGLLALLPNEHHKAKKTTVDIFGDTVQELSALGQKPC